MTLVRVLYDERLSNDQRLIISKLMNSKDPIVSAKVVRDNFGTRLIFERQSGAAGFVGNNGSLWLATTETF